MKSETNEFNAVAQAIERDGWYVTDTLLPTPLVSALADECRQLDALSRLKPAGVGRGQQRRMASAIRGDRTHWLDDSFSEIQATFLSHMLELRDALNHRLLLGLRDLEAHYAVYPAGAHYDRHRDRFRDDDARTLTAVIYLNEDWRAEDQGALRLYLPDGSHHDVLPLAGRTVLFLSADFDHEVLAPMRPRMSIAGWFRRREAYIA
jgi:SM-20-related protein